MESRLEFFIRKLIIELCLDINEELDFLGGDKGKSSNFEEIVVIENSKKEEYKREAIEYESKKSDKHDEKYSGYEEPASGESLEYTYEYERSSEEERGERGRGRGRGRGWGRGGGGGRGSRGKGRGRYDKKPFHKYDYHQSSSEYHQPSPQVSYVKRPMHEEAESQAHEYTGHKPIQNEYPDERYNHKGKTVYYKKVSNP